MSDRNRGFTLLEILIAVAVFSILAAAAYAALDSLADATGYHRDRAEEFQAVQMTISRLDMDLRQLVSRSIRDEDGREQPALRGTETELEATRSGWANPLGVRRSEFQRFGWRADAGRLHRTTWPVTDRVAGTSPDTTPYLEGLQRLQLRYQDRSGQWQTHWPDGGPDEGSPAVLPRAVEYRLELDDGRYFERLILVDP